MLLAPGQPGLACPRFAEQGRISISIDPSCISWVDPYEDETGFRIVWEYINSGEIFVYEVGPGVTELFPAEEHAPRLGESREQCMRRKDFTLTVIALRPGLPGGDKLIDQVAMIAECFLPELPTATPSLQALALQAGFDPAVYPPAVPTSGQAATFLKACPDPSRLEDIADLPLETALERVDDLRSDDLLTMMAASDPSWWDFLSSGVPDGGMVTAEWADTPLFPARQSPYAANIANQCGDDLLAKSWSLRICPGPCAPGGPESLKADYFFLKRNGIVLIWMIW
jgi:hypothetical protein